VEELADQDYAFTPEEQRKILDRLNELVKR
jgi:hypothetical protein